MNRKPRKIAVLTICLIATAMLIIGFVTSVSLASNKFNILVLGDSLAKGTGDETGKGFAGYYADHYAKRTTKSVTLKNLAVNGNISSGLLKIIKASKTKSCIKNANVILISIGGNEITKLKNSDLSIVANSLKGIQQQYTDNIKEILKQIRINNTTCQIIFIGLYNPFGKSITADKITIINNWNNNTKRLISTDLNSFYIPTYDLFDSSLSAYLATDNFHPNSAGYRAIASRITTVIASKK